MKIKQTQYTTFVIRGDDNGEQIRDDPNLICVSTEEFKQSMTGKLQENREVTKVNLPGFWKRLYAYYNFRRAARAFRKCIVIVPKD